jgi:hypothetical protein
VNEDEGGDFAEEWAHACLDCPGWICFRSRRYVTRNIALHEVAHLLVPESFPHGFRHGAAFYEKLAELHGGRLPRHDAQMRPDHEAQAARLAKLGKEECMRQHLAEQR